jgi:hypothetical protein
VPTILFGFTALDVDGLPTWILANATQPLEIAEALVPEPTTVALSVVALLVGVGIGLRARASLGDGGSTLARGLGIDAAYDRLAVRPFLTLVRWTTDFDGAVIGRVVSGVGTGTTAAGVQLQRTQRGDVQRYVSAALTALVVAVVIILVAVST